MSFFISILAKSPLLGLVYLRHDYVEGCQNGPTAYLEGIFIIPDYRSQGIGDKLLSFAISGLKIVEYLNLHLTRNSIINLVRVFMLNTVSGKLAE